MPQLSGVFAKHTPESCPLNNAANKEVFSKLDERMEQAMEKNGVKKAVGFYFQSWSMSGRS